MSGKNTDFEARNGTRIEEYALSLDLAYRKTEVWLEPWAVEALREYFAARPVLRPWEGAQEDDVWIVTYEDREFPAFFQAGRFRDANGSWDISSISDARKIYPPSDF